MKSYRSSKLLKYAGMIDGIDGRFVSRLVQTTNPRYVVGNPETEICFQTILLNTPSQAMIVTILEVRSEGI
jgi:hypothetical protein